MKKINKDFIAIKSLLNKGLKLIQIANLLGVYRQKVNYWKKNEIKITQTRRKKLDAPFIKKVRELAENKTTSDMSSRLKKQIIFLIKIENRLK